MRGGGGVGLLHGLKNEPNKRAVQIRRRGQTRLLYLTVEYNYFYKFNMSHYLFI